ncbi:hypothetical protein RB597_008809 [Gaeumannomyces tritici]
MPDTAAFPIPEGTALAMPSVVEERPEAEVIASLLKDSARVPGPKAPQKNVWCYWHAGWAAMPPWTKRNVIAWSRRLAPSGWTVRVLDGVPGSPSNAIRFVPARMLPPALVERRLAGPYAATHSADLIRLPLLYIFGGVWMDVGTILFGNLDDIWGDIADVSSPRKFSAFVYAVRGPDAPLSIVNNFLACNRGNGMVRRWHDTVIRVWGTADRCDGLSQHPLLRHLAPYPSPDGKADPQKIMDYGVQVFCLERLRELVDPKDRWDGPDYFSKNMLLLPASSEMWHYNNLAVDKGRKQFELLSTRRPDGGLLRKEELEKSAAAESFVQDVLANRFVMKLCHGLKDVLDEPLTSSWDDPQNDGVDCAPGTYAEYLRWGSVHLKQTRKLEPAVLEPLTTEPYKIGLYDPVPREGEVVKTPEEEVAGVKAKITEPDGRKLSVFAPCT